MYSAIQTSRSMGMQTLDQCLVDLVRRNQINIAEARNRAVNKDLFMGRVMTTPTLAVLAGPKGEHQSLGTARRD